MEIRRGIYEAYCEGLLSIEPEPPSVSSENALHSLKESLCLSDGDSERFDRVFSDIVIDAEKRGFYAGMKIILRLLSE